MRVGKTKASSLFRGSKRTTDRNCGPSVKSRHDLIGMESMTRTRTPMARCPITRRLWAPQGDPTQSKIIMRHQWPAGRAHRSHRCSLRTAGLCSSAIGTLQSPRQLENRGSSSSAMGDTGSRPCHAEDIPPRRSEIIVHLAIPASLPPFVKETQKGKESHGSTFFNDSVSTIMRQRIL